MSRTDDILRDLRSGMRDAEIARKHGVSRQWVFSVRTQAGLPRSTPPPTPPKPPPPNRWTDEHDAYLVAHADQPNAEVAHALGRTVSAIEYRRSQLLAEGRTTPRLRRFSDAELAILADTSLTDAEVADRTRRSLAVIFHARTMRGIATSATPLQAWTAEEEARLIALDGTPLVEVAAALGRSRSSVKAKRLKLMAQGRLTHRRRIER